MLCFVAVDGEGHVLDGDIVRLVRLVPAYLCYEAVCERGRLLEPESDRERLGDTARVFQLAYIGDECAVVPAYRGIACVLFCQQCAARGLTRAVDDSIKGIIGLAGIPGYLLFQLYAVQVAQDTAYQDMRRLIAVDGKGHITYP